MTSSVAPPEARDFGAARVRAILAPYDLLRAYDYVVARNPSNELPYHNLHHTSCLTIHCAEGAVAMDLPDERRRPLLVAAVFHDFGHSGGAQSDEHNIRVAVAAFKAHAAEDASFGDCLPEIVRLIETTQFPPIDEAATLSEKIIRDADLMQVYVPGWREQILNGLREEIAVSKGKSVSLSEMTQIQLSFMRAVKWNTPWAVKRADGAWAALIEEVQQIAATL